MADQLAAAVQHSPCQRGNPDFTFFQISVFSLHTGQLSFLQFRFFLVSDSLLLSLLGCTMFKFAQPRLITLPRRLFCCLRSFPHFTWDYKWHVICLFHSLGVLGIPAFQDAGRSTSLCSNIPSLQRHSGVCLCSYRDDFASTESLPSHRKRFLHS